MSADWLTNEAAAFLLGYLLILQVGFQILLAISLGYPRTDLTRCRAEAR